MDTRQIGSLEVSTVGLGCNNFGRHLDSDATSAVVDAALDIGITFFDTADVYGGTKSEEYLGRALGRRCDEVVVATKFGSAVDEQRMGARTEYVHQAVEDSLHRLGTDRIDLYQLHTPDPKVPIEDTLSALDELVREGKVREIGCSNFLTVQLRAAEKAARDGAARFVSVQNEYSLLHREPEGDVLPECERAGMAFILYFPLANSLLTGKYRQGQDAPAGSRLHSGREIGYSRTETLPSWSDSSGSRRGGVHDTGISLLMAAHAADRGVGDRRGYVARAGEEQRGRCQLGTDRYGAG